MWKSKQGIERRSRRYLLHLLVSSGAASLFERTQYFPTLVAATSQIRATVSVDGTVKPAAKQDKFDRVTTVLIGKGRGGGGRLSKEGEAECQAESFHHWWRIAVKSWPTKLIVPVWHWLNKYFTLVGEVRCFPAVDPTVRPTRPLLTEILQQAPV